MQQTSPLGVGDVETGDDRRIVSGSVAICVEVSQAGGDTQNVDDSTVLRGNRLRRAVRWAARNPFPGLAPATTFGPTRQLKGRRSARFTYKNHPLFLQPTAVASPLSGDNERFFRIAQAVFHRKSARPYRKAIGQQAASRFGAKWIRPLGSAISDPRKRAPPAGTLGNLPRAVRMGEPRPSPITRRG